MSANRRRQSRRPVVPYDVPSLLVLWQQALDLRRDWLARALATTPTDRGRTEDAVLAVYERAGQPPPEFVWVPSPKAVTQVLPARSVVVGHHLELPWASVLADVHHQVRERLDGRLGVRRVNGIGDLFDVEAAVRRGVDLAFVLDAGVRRWLERVVRGHLVGVLVGACPDLPGLRWLGQHEVDWLARYDAHVRLLGSRLRPDEQEYLDTWTALAEGAGWWWPRDGVCVLAERPCEVRTEGSPDDEVGPRLHAADGPAVRYPDGWGVHVWHGTRVPAWALEAPSVELIAAEPNVEVRRCAIERMGWDRYVDEAALRLLARADDPGNPGAELRLYADPRPPSGAGTRLLVAVNGSLERDGTRRRYGLHVPDDLDDPVAAAAWSYGLDRDSYALLARRT